MCGLVNLIAVLQRVKNSKVEVNGKTIGKIGNGLNILLGIVKNDKKKRCGFSHK